MNINNEKILMEMANSIRALSIDAIENANSGHPGMPMGCSFKYSVAVWIQHLKLSCTNW